ncbi:hypothetical protein ASE41_20410 [Streptomyces sp. Root264]|nr:hypothetical protein ASE41_20410 [Streptomyces sp. Root264]
MTAWAALRSSWIFAMSASVTVAPLSRTSLMSASACSLAATVFAVVPLLGMPEKNRLSVAGSILRSFATSFWDLPRSKKIFLSS